jgi:predicted tellurium resistance membrane protein TerC
VIERYPPLVDGAFIIIAWVGIKLVVEFAHLEGYIPFQVPQWLSLGLIVVIFLLALGYARREERRRDHAAKHLLEREQRERS